ncbi:GNAT family N-acetyltransferase [Pseudomonas sp. 15FMM2]|uniref:GNAT family N-acetyltransferase n=1 Tax=Pseudomonas imrae TaxID=2992837 RepID=A0ACC7P8E2_9PSED
MTLTTLPKGLQAFVPEDLEAMRGILNETIETGINSALTEQISSEQFAYVVNNYHRQGFPIYVLKRRGEVIGFVWVHSFCWGGDACRHTGETVLYIRKDHHGRGAGVPLARAAIDLARCHGFESIVVWVLEGNDASLRIAKAMGLERWGYLPNVARLGDQPRSVHLYGRSLLPP